ncbi:MAG: FHA domain-containing protein [Anaerolineae bacterium]
MPRLIMKRGPEPGRSYELRGDVVVVGRGSKCDIVLQDNEVSRTHCRFLKVLADYELHDLESANGTFVNGQRVLEPWLLQDDCIIEIGDSITFHFERGSAPLDPKKVKEMPKVPKKGSDHETEESQVLKRQPYLVLNISSRGDMHEVFPLSEQTISLGRDLSNTIVVQEPEVSRYHLRLSRTDHGYTVQDLGTTNGTTLNGAPLSEPQVLRLDDVLQIGSLINLLYTNDPEKYKSRIKTDTLPTMDDTSGRPGIHRETTPANVFANVSNKRKTSILGTGLQPGALEDHIFLAYSRDDWEAIVAPLMLRLQDAKLNVWVEQYLKPGQDDWVVAVEQALAECWLMVVVVSPAALEAKPVTLQYRYFYNREKPIITMLYKPISGPLPPELIKQRNVRYDERDRTKTFQRLIFEIMHNRMK